MRPLRFLFPIVKKYKLSLVITVVSMLLLVGVQLLIPWIIKSMVSAATDPSGNQMSYALVTKLAVFAFLVYVAGRAPVSAQLYGTCGWVGCCGGCAQADL